MTRKVLVVEDNELLVRVYDSVFKSLGCRTVHARTVSDALRVLLDERPDLVIMDINLPDGSGVQATRDIRLHKEFSHVPIIAVTTRAGAANEQAIREAGCSAFIAKPIQVAAFSELVQRYLGAAPG